MNSHVENCLPASFYIICGSTADKALHSLYLSLCLMTFCSGEYDGFCKNPALLPVMCYLIDFVDIVHTVHNFMRRKEVVSSIFGKES